jgi:hypothetical protein
MNKEKINFIFKKYSICNCMELISNGGKFKGLHMYIRKCESLG